MTANNRTEAVRDAADDPRVQWRDDAVPYSSRFADTYFSDVDGRAETAEVFLGGNGLPDRWSLGGDFVIAELGFGTGLNFLETVFQWRRHARRRGRLRFVSFEMFPMRRADLYKALSVWPEIEKLAPEFLNNWSEVGDVFRAETDDVRLEVHIGDARQHLAQSAAQPAVHVDAWYLDGFSPAHNPELWEQALLRHVFDSTVPGGTFSTYTAAGWVRRNLQAAGFVVDRVPGYGRKRERLQGIKPATD